MAGSRLRVDEVMAANVTAAARSWQGQLIGSRRTLAGEPRALQSQ
jgi:hypothetical protein